LRKINAQLRYYYPNLDVEGLSDEKWAMLWNDLKWVREEEAKESLKRL